MRVGSLVMCLETKELGIVLHIEVHNNLTVYPVYQDVWILALWSGGTIEATVTECVELVQ